MNSPLAFDHENVPARGVVIALESLGLAGAILRATGEVIQTTERLNAFSRIVRVTQIGLQWASAATQQNYLIALSEITASASGRMVPIRQTEQSPPGLICLRKVDTDGVAPTVIMTLNVKARPKTPPLDVIQAMFGLTAAEARIMIGICQGRNPLELATLFNVSLGTIRSQLKSVLTKTGATRQVELIAMVASLQPSICHHFRPGMPLFDTGIRRTVRVIRGKLRK